jgi:hypothetical protein
VHTYSNAEQHWKGNEDWGIQIHYTKLQDTENINIKAIVVGSFAVGPYESFTGKPNIHTLPYLYREYERIQTDN